MFWMLLSSLMFACMGVCIKFASAHFHVFEVVFYRGLVGVGVLYAMAKWRGIVLRTQVPGMHAWRCVVGVCSLVGWFYGISTLPLATAMTLNYMSSVWIAVFLLAASIIMRIVQPSDSNTSPPPLWGQWPLLLTVLGGFMGVALLLRPTLAPHQYWSALVGLCAGMCAALAYLQVTALTKVGEPEERVVFYFSLAAVLSGGIGMMLVGTSPWHWEAAWWLLPTGIFALFGQLLMTRAYASGATLVVANLQYSGIVFASLFGVWLFQETLPWISWFGMMVTIGCGVLATIVRKRAMPQAPEEDH